MKVDSVTLQIRSPARDVYRLESSNVDADVENRVGALAYSVVDLLSAFVLLMAWVN